MKANTLKTVSRWIVAALLLGSFAYSALGLTVAPVHASAVCDEDACNAGYGDAWATCLFRGADVNWYYCPNDPPDGDWYSYGCTDDFNGIGYC